MSLQSGLTMDTNWSDVTDQAPAASRAPAPAPTPAPAPAPASTSELAVEEPLPNFALPEHPPFKAFIRNLPYKITDDDIGHHFNDTCGEVVDVHLLMNRDDGRPKGSGFVEFKTMDALEKALAFDGQQVFGRRLSVDVAE